MVTGALPAVFLVRTLARPGGDLGEASSAATQNDSLRASG